MISEEETIIFTDNKSRDSNAPFGTIHNQFPDKFFEIYERLIRENAILKEQNTNLQLKIEKLEKDLGEKK